jgi:hypothetical protein
MSSASGPLNLMNRETFAALTLHGKNDYLQDITRQLMEGRGEEFIPLSKDALSRLRRFYSRRSVADLRLENIEDSELRERMLLLGENIYGKEIGKIL